MSQSRLMGMIRRCATVTRSGKQNIWHREYLCLFFFFKYPLPSFLCFNSLQWIPERRERKKKAGLSTKHQRNSLCDTVTYSNRTVFDVMPEIIYDP